MTIHSPWETSPSKTGLIHVGTHCLLTHVHGPPRLHPASSDISTLPPLLLLEAGGGATYTIYLGLIRSLANNHGIRSLTYNRANLSGSDPHPSYPAFTPRSAISIAADFENLLLAAGVKPPFVLFAHSYSGIQVRTWMEVYGRVDDVVGIVFMDTAMEDTYALLPLRQAQWGFLQGLENVGKVLGYDDHHPGLTETEYARLQVEAEEGREILDVDVSAEVLRGYRQLERGVLGEGKAVSVIKGCVAEDLRRLCVEAERVGLGTKEQRDVVWRSLERLDEVFDTTERKQLMLSGTGRMVYAGKEAGHAVVFHDLDLVVKEVKWVFDQWEKKLER